MPLPAEGALGPCLEIHDLVLSKYAAGREKDREYVRTAIRHGMVDHELLARRLETMPLAVETRASIRTFIDADFQS